uniref:Uncharacterized protein n=1 Tax=Heterorhabditis bacteriophora TaxID=37862 RepID=A0A1I7WFD7_HETBA
MSGDPSVLSPPPPPRLCPCSGLYTPHSGMLNIIMSKMLLLTISFYKYSELLFSLIYNLK